MFGAAISFPNLGIEIEKLKNTFSVFGVEIAFYGIIIGIGILAGAALSFREAKKTGQNIDNYIDLALYGVLFAIVGARLYYVLFEWDYYKDNLLEIFNLRKGGLAIYGGIIAAIITAYVLAKKKKLSFWEMADTGCIGLITGQIIGRWGNFFNREAFGGNSDGLFAMRIDTMDADVKVNVPNGVGFIDDANRYIQVQPTFLYESVWNLFVLILIMIFRKHKKYNGEVFLWYLFGYGLGRSFIEGMRTDQLLLPIVKFPVSQLLSILLAIGIGGLLIYNRVRILGKKKIILPDTVKLSDTENN